MHGNLIRQFALDYCCTEEEAGDDCNHFTVWQPKDGQRGFDNSNFLKIAVLGGKLLVTGDEAVVAELHRKIGRFRGAWFMDAGALSNLDRLLAPYGYQIKQAHVFYIAEKETPVCTDGWEIRWYSRAEIPQFEADKRFEEAFAFCDTAPDVLGVAAIRDGEILGMAGASADSPALWQIGINTAESAAGRGVGSMLVGLMKNEVLRRGILPYYGTAMSHIASQRVALNAGFLPAWAELTTQKLEP